jgi:hypothetical protein
MLCNWFNYFITTTTLDSLLEMRTASRVGGSVIYMPYAHNFLTRGNGHRVLISDIQLLQWYSQRRDIRRNPLPYYAVVKAAVMDLLAHRETLAMRSDDTQLLITPALTDDGTTTNPPTHAVIQHATPPLPPPLPPSPSLVKLQPNSALLYYLSQKQPATIRRDRRTRAKTLFYLQTTRYSCCIRNPPPKKPLPLQYSQQTTMTRIPTATSCARM